MRIAINIIPLGEGALVRERHLIHSLKGIDHDNEYVIIGQRERSVLFPDLAPNFRYYPIDFGSVLARTIWENVTLPRLLRRLGTEVLYFPFHKTNLVSPCRKIIAVRNAAPFDPYVVKGYTSYERFRLNALRLATKLSVHTSQHTIFMSSTFRDLLDRKYGIRPAASSVVHHGVPSGFEPKPEFPPGMAEGLRVPDEYILVVSHVYRYKNIMELVQAYVDVSRSVPFPLLIAGNLADDAYCAKIMAFVEKHAMGDRVRFLGNVSHDALAHLYSNCVFFAFPSACENAPLTLVEAMACGAPIMSSRVSGMPEVCGDAALYFDPNNVPEIASCLVELSGDSALRARLREKSQRRASRFSWEEAAKQTLEIFRRVHGQS